jgi:nucleosome binding factor SPN SPT16 subunit
VRSAPTQQSPAATARAREDAAIAAARARTQENTRKHEQDAAAVRAQQAAINRKRDEDAARRAAATRSGPSAASGPARYNTSSSNSVTIGSDRRTGGATPADRAAMDKINADAKKLRDSKRKP